METKLSSAVLLLIVLLLLPSITTAHRLNHELSLAISALRYHGYSLFPNAVTESDLLSSQNFSALTFFSPPDSLLYSPNSDSLFRFVSPFRFPTSRIRILSYYGTCLKTLLPHHHLFIQRREVLLNGTVLDSVTVDGMRLSLPDLFVGSSIVVHGLDQILESKVLPIDKLVAAYLSSWTKTSLLRPKNRTNLRDIEIMENGVYWDHGKVEVWNL
ncbi:hypothetical protein Dsin_016283 [Dipteronia sinensis]|uniref:FAS1 domain-containing protein n=1 Tax=Dipteronia sinensis TaxID=43782 RepID=A0AAE0AE20_9ROSI|nr:hypothetical protein Dsin_016283 [Dipteronia sinensis]